MGWMCHCFVFCGGEGGAGGAYFEDFEVGATGGVGCEGWWEPPSWGPCSLQAPL